MVNKIVKNTLKYASSSSRINLLFSKKKKKWLSAPNICSKDAHLIIMSSYWDKRGKGVKKKYGAAMVTKILKNSLKITRCKEKTGPLKTLKYKNLE